MRVLRPVNVHVLLLDVVGGGWCGLPRVLRAAFVINPAGLRARQKREDSMPRRIDRARSALHQLPTADRLLLLDGISPGERQQLLTELAETIVHQGADAPVKVRAWAEMWLAIGSVQEAVAS